MSCDIISQLIMDLKYVVLISVSHLFHLSVTLLLIVGLQRVECRSYLRWHYMHTIYHLFNTAVSNTDSLVILAYLCHIQEGMEAKMSCHYLPFGLTQWLVYLHRSFSVTSITECNFLAECCTCGG